MFSVMKFVLGIFNIMVGLYVLMIYLGQYVGIRSDFSSKLKVSDIRDIKLGMTSDQVLMKLGKPSKSDTACNNNVVFTFSKPVEHCLTYPMLWVAFKNDKVVYVTVKAYGIYEDPTIYSLSWAVDSTSFNTDYSKTELYKEDHMLARCFDPSNAILE